MVEVSGKDRERVDGMVAKWKLIREAKILPDPFVKGSTDPVARLREYHENMEDTQLLELVNEMSEGILANELQDAEKTIVQSAETWLMTIEAFLGSQDIQDGIPLLLNGTATGDIVSMLCCMTHMYEEAEHILRKLSPGRHAATNWTELRYRLETMRLAFSYVRPEIFESEADAKETDMMSKWSELWLQEKDANVLKAKQAEVNFGADFGNLGALLTKLRSSSIDNHIDRFFQQELAITGGKQPAASAVQSALNLQGQLPPKTADCIQQAVVYQRLETTLRDEANGKKPGVCHLVNLYGDLKALRLISDADVVAKIKRLDDLAEKQLNQWCTANSFVDFKEHFEYFDGFHSSLLRNDPSKYTWVTESDAAVEKKVGHFQEMHMNAHTAHRIAVILEVSLKNTKFHPQVQAVVADTKFAIDTFPKAALIVASIALACILCAKSRSSTFEADLSNAKRFIRETCKVKIDALPPYLKDKLGQVHFGGKIEDTSATDAVSGSAPAKETHSGSSASASTAASSAEAEAPAKKRKKMLPSF